MDGHDNFPKQFIVGRNIGTKQPLWPGGPKAYITQKPGYSARPSFLQRATYHGDDRVTDVVCNTPANISCTIQRG